MVKLLFSGQRVWILYPDCSRPRPIPPQKLEQEKEGDDQVNHVHLIGGAPGGVRENWGSKLGLLDPLYIFISHLDALVSGCGPPDSFSEKD